MSEKCPTCGHEEPEVVHPECDYCHKPMPDGGVLSGWWMYHGECFKVVAKKLSARGFYTE